MNQFSSLTLWHWGKSVWKSRLLVLNVSKQITKYLTIFKNWQKKLRSQKLWKWTHLQWTHTIHVQIPHHPPPPDVMASVLGDISVSEAALQGHFQFDWKSPKLPFGNRIPLPASQLASSKESPHKTGIPASVRVWYPYVQCTLDCSLQPTYDTVATFIKVPVPCLICKVNVHYFFLTYRQDVWVFMVNVDKGWSFSSWSFLFPYDSRLDGHCFFPVLRF